MAFIFGFIILLAWLFYSYFYGKKQASNKFHSTIAGTDFNPTYTYPNKKTPILAIDPNKKQFYIAGKIPKIYHASEVTHIQTKPEQHGGVLLSITVTDLDEPIKYIFFKNSYIADEWFGRIQAVWNIR